MLDRTTPPAAQRISSINFAKAKSISLSNGTPLHIIQAGEHDILRLEIIMKSGRWFENRKGSAYFASQMLLEGTSGKSSKDLADIFEFHGAHVSINSGIDYNTFVVYTLSSKLGEIIDVIGQCLSDPVFPESELNILKDIQKQQLRINNEKNNYVAGKEIRKLLYSNAHPYGRSLELEDMDDTLNSGVLKQYYLERLVDNVEIIISGKVTDEIIRSLEVLSFLPAVSGKYLDHTIGDAGRPEITIEKPDSLQSSIRLGRRIIHKTHEDYIGLLVLNELLGGFFGSRLMKNIREEKGYTYGIHSSLVSHIHDSFWVIGTDVKKEYVSDTVEQVYYEMDRLRNDIISNEEMDLLQNYMLGNFISSLETSFSLADKFKNIHFFGQDYGFYDKYIDTINSITPQRLNELANTYLNSGAFRKAVVG
jgi:predicted Zn-dependent peptidase